MRISLLILAFVVTVRGQTYWDYREALIKDEGYRTTIYHDSRGNPSIGIGHLVRNWERFDTPISRAEVDRLFMTDLGKAIAAARAAIPSFDIQPKEVKILIISMSFNLGAKGIMGFKRFRQAIEDMDYLRASVELRNSLYYRQLPKRVGRYIKILEREARFKA